MITELGDIFNYEKARFFYKEIRCGILHSAETGKNAILTLNSDNALIIEKSKLMVNVRAFTNYLFDYYEQYITKIKDTANYELRKNFIYKMNLIANK